MISWLNALEQSGISFSSKQQNKHSPLAYLSSIQLVEAQLLTPITNRQYIKLIVPTQ